MSIYIPLARRYRPKKFSEVIGQDIAIKILSQAIQNGRLGSAILLNGTRGVGKTTLARILAKVIRCENSGIDPCQKCPTCLDFDTNNVDVIEMDAASHTGVEDIRDIIESCQYLPSIGRYKVFIIDEVHMLSKSAFNALLKTLEEPPEHVKFLFATTEIQKIPETILSRCLRFNLKRIDTELLTQYLSSICLKEHIQFEDRAIRLIANAANGSIRDALSTLEQAINVSDSILQEAQIRELLSGMSYSEAFVLLKQIFESDTKSAISTIRRSVISGTSPEEIVTTLMNLVHKITCLRVGANYFGDCALENDDEIGLALLAKEMSISKLSSLWQMLEKGNAEINDLESKRIVIEMLVVRLCYASSLPDIAEIIKQHKETSKAAEKSKKDNSDELLTKRTLDVIKSDNTSVKDAALQMFSGAKIIQ